MKGKQAGFLDSLLDVFKPKKGKPSGTPPVFAHPPPAAKAPSALKSIRQLAHKLNRMDPKASQAFVKSLSQDIGTEAGGAAAKQMSLEAEVIVRNVQKALGPMVEEAMGKGRTKAMDWGREAFQKGRRLARTGGALGLAGGAAGAATGALQDKHREGLSRGIAGGLLGAAAMAAVIPKKVGTSGKGMLPLLGGALLGGSFAGYTAKGTWSGKKSKKKEASMFEGHKYAGVTLDYYDDHGETLKSMFPTPDELPDMIKSANVQAKDKLPNEAFALIMLDSGHVFRKFACADPGTTAMSVIYFMEHGNKLPEDAQKTAATNLVQACIEHGILPPAALTKTSAPRYAQLVSVNGQKLEEPVSIQTKLATVDVTGKNPEPKVVVDRPVDEDDYAVKLADGSLHYPIDTWERVKTAEAYFQEERIRMDPEVRRQYAVKLARKSYIIGYPLDRNIVELGALSYHGDGHLKYAMEMRKSAFEPASAEREFLDDLFEKRAEVHPEVYAECLKRFDTMNDLNSGWDQVILDPWASTFGVKTAAVVWEQGAERVTEEELVNLAHNDPEAVKRQFTEQFLDQFQKDPVTLFNSMPDPQKKLLARLAGDVAHSGESEFMATKAPEQAAGGHEKSLP